MHDRFGNDRCDGYRKKDFVLCENCVPDGNVNKAKLNHSCYICGGCGEYPKTRKHQHSSKAHP